MGQKPVTAQSTKFGKKAWIQCGMGLVALSAIYVSGQHIVHVSMHYGQIFAAAIMLPMILDVFGLFCAVRLRLPNISDIARGLARIGMWFALGTSLWINVESALITNAHRTGFDLAKALFISSIPALIVWLTAEILTHVRKTPSKSATSRTRKPAEKPATATKAATGTPRQRTPRKTAQNASEPVLTGSSAQ